MSASCSARLRFEGEEGRTTRMLVPVRVWAEVFAMLMTL